VIIRRPETQANRPGATSVEFAMVASTVLLLLIGLIVGALGVFRYQEMGRLAREAARYAAVRGEAFSRATGRPAATADEVLQKAILPAAIILDPAKLTADVSWAPDKQPGGQVTVTVKYQWLPEAYFKAMTLESTATMPVTY
jgi:Flp pilus assembly protein TadG